MRIRESAYIALLCLFFAVNNSTAQNNAGDLPDRRQQGRTYHSGSWNISFLSQPKLQLQSLQAGHTALFSSFTECEIFDFGSRQWELYQFPVPRRGAATIAGGNNAFFAGGSRGPKLNPEFLDRVDIYAAETNSWRTAKLSEKREVGGSGTFGNVVVFAGGVNGKGYSNRADVFNTERKQRTHILSEARNVMATSAAGNKIVFAGGMSGDITHPRSSSAVDIYEVHSNTWTVAKLSQARHDMAAATVGNQVIFAGGLINATGISIPTAAIDIYDAVRNTWKTAELSEAKHGMTVATVGNKVYFAGGLLKGDVLSNKIEVYDLETDTWTTTTLPAGRYGMAVGIAGSQLMFAGGFINNLQTATDRVEIQNTETGTWLVERLSQARTSITAASYQGRVIFAGGTDTRKMIASAAVDLWEPTSGTQQAIYNPVMATNNIYPTGKRPVYDWVYADPKNSDYLIADLWRYETQTVNINILNANRQAMITKSVIPFGDTKEQIDVSGLQRGLYWVLVECDGRKPVLKQVDIKGTVIDQSSNMFAMSFANPDAGQPAW